ncbi:hypothetical protein HF638_27750 [Paenibacillus sp. SZ31]|uniref:hypothetical protein n=1 Tax=Paenibacillus sp. SZ31 TaxID=2725555 RepID=UPI00146DDC74|nr:hypothetical protein [Paenibacillus sp. SZ31]NMI07795.1 hypothetical protein [Paenibacillus sp. SZ31]
MYNIVLDNADTWEIKKKITSSTSKSNYTGKIDAIDTIYVWNGTSYRGGSEDAKSPLAPGPAAGAWNGFASLPYSYDAVYPADLQTKLNASGGAGAGRLYGHPFSG